VGIKIGSYWVHVDSGAVLKVERKDGPFYWLRCAERLSWHVDRWTLADGIEYRPLGRKEWLTWLITPQKD